MMPLGQIPVTITLGAVTYTDALHIYPEVKVVLLSWKTSKALTILPTNYPSPLSSLDTPLTSATTTQEDTTPSLDPAKEFPTVFDGNITQMDGEQFHITLTDEAKTFCIKTSRTVPFTYRDKLRAELEILETQGIIAPVTYPTEWCDQKVVVDLANYLNPQLSEQRSIYLYVHVCYFLYNVFQGVQIHVSEDGHTCTCIIILCTVLSAHTI